jgi:hypothetical protein
MHEEKQVPKTQQEIYFFCRNHMAVLTQNFYPSPTFSSW